MNVAKDFGSTSLLLLQESFDGLSSLKELYLDYNRIEEIQPGTFTQLGFLNMLAVTHNQLVYIPNLAFQVLFSNNCFFLPTIFSVSTNELSSLWHTCPPGPEQHKVATS